MKYKMETVLFSKNKVALDSKNRTKIKYKFIHASKWWLVSVLLLTFVFLAACAGDDARRDTASAPNMAQVTGNGAWVGSFDGVAFSYAAAWETVEEPAVGAAPGGAATPQAPAQPRRMIIRTASINMRTDYFDDTVTAMRSIINEHGGYTEAGDLSINTRGQNIADGRVYNATFRVPSYNYDAARTQIEALGNVFHSSETADDRTMEYHNLASRLETRRIEEERVLELISIADNVEDLLALEERLGRIRTDIEVFESRMRNIDRLAAFSTIHVSLHENTRQIIALSISDDLGGRIQRAFAGSVNGTVRFFQGVLIFFAGAVVPLLMLAIPGLAAFLIVRRIRRPRIS